ncbi:MAG: hypothetical protein P4L81_07405 [Candidatus Pacebacteria bacterium]|nr:hypothetical protein [Candidatus Paceibacterota bacterium]
MHGTHRDVAAKDILHPQRQREEKYPISELEAWLLGAVLLVPIVMITVQTLR